MLAEGTGIADPLDRNGLADTFEQVLRDPAVAKMAEHVASRGPAVNVGLVVATDSLEMAAFGDRPELVRALTACSTNRLAFGRGTFEQPAELCRQRHNEAVSAALAETASEKRFAE